MNRIAIFWPNWIGDVVMATPAVRGLRERFANAELVSVCKSYVADTLSGCPWFAETIRTNPKGPREGRFWGAVKRLRQKPLDAAVLFPNSFRAALLAKLGGAKRVVGFARYGRSLLLSDRLYAARDVNGKFIPVPAIDDYIRIVQKLGVPHPGFKMDLFTTPDDEAAAEVVWNRFKNFNTVVGLNPGGAFGSSKHWPTDYFVELAKSLAAKGYGVLALCGPSERETANTIVQKAKSPAVVGLGDSPLSIGLTKALVKRLSLLITTDSGPRHFAAAFNVPTVTLFGPTHIGWTETYFDRAIHLQKPVPCGPCQLRVCPLDHRCMLDLKPAEVLGAAERLLKPRTMELPLRSERRHAG